MKITPDDLAHYISPSIKEGETYGLLTILKTGRYGNPIRYYAYCKCSCGSEPKMIRLDSIVDKSIRSCGCYHLSKTKTHGLSQTHIYTVWRHMMVRCYNNKNLAYNNYGGRGITVCKRWHDVSNFYNDMQPSYVAGLEIDRINNDGNYEPSNCRWATNKEQSNNRRSNVKHTFNGKTQSLSQWSKDYGIKYRVLWDRVNCLKWCMKDALETPTLSYKECGVRARASQLSKN